MAGRSLTTKPLGVFVGDWSMEAGFDGTPPADVNARVAKMGVTS